MNAAILGIGPVSALGCGAASLLEGLEGARRPLIETHEIATPGGPVRMPVYTARADGLDRFAPKRALRRMDPFASMALLSAFLSIEDAGIAFPDPERVGLVFGSGYGPLQTTFAFQDSLIDFGDRCASPTHFANSVHNALASQVSISLGIQGPTHTVTSGDQTTAGALLTALLWLNEDAADYVLMGVGDEFCPVRGYALARGPFAAEMRDRRDATASMRPLEFDACSYVPGEGFVTLLLGKADAPKSYARVSRVVMGRGLLDGERDSIDSLDAVIIAANGNAAEGAAYRRCLRRPKKVGAYAALYGGMPTGDGFDLSIAALSLREGKLFPAGGATAGGATAAAVSREGLNAAIRTEPLLPEARIGCLKCAADGFGSLAMLSK